MAISLDPHGSRQLAIRDHQIQMMQGQLGKELLRFFLLTEQAYRLGQGEGWR